VVAELPVVPVLVSPGRPVGPCVAAAPHVPRRAIPRRTTVAVVRRLTSCPYLRPNEIRESHIDRCSLARMMSRHVERRTRISIISRSSPTNESINDMFII